MHNYYTHDFGGGEAAKKIMQAIFVLYIFANFTLQVSCKNGEPPKMRPPQKFLRGPIESSDMHWESAVFIFMQVYSTDAIQCFI